MGVLSDAVSLDRVSRVVGYKITKGQFNTVTPNLPQRIAIIGEANDANQASLSLTPFQFTNAQQVGQLYGYGSPLYHIARILRPLLSGDGVAGIPTYIYPQAAAPGAAAKSISITASGVATANGTHYLNIAGREGQDGVFYALNIVVGDTATTIAQKICDAINACLGAPVLASNAGYEAILTSKWKGLTSNELSVVVDTGVPAVSLGITYSIVTLTAGSGTPSISAALTLFGNDWNTIVVNSYGLQSTVMSTLEQVNGIPDPLSPTGRYSGLIMKPFIAISGSVSDDPSATTDARQNEVTIAVAPAPLSAGFSFEAAANMAYLQAITGQNNPHLDIEGQSYPDMPIPFPVGTSIGSMAVYANRDVIVKKGCSTVNLSGSQYKVEDFVTTYHPVGENPPQFRYVRNLNLDFNVKYGYYLLQDVNVRDHVIATDTDIVTASYIVKPKMWKAVINGYADDLVARGLIVQASFMQDSITVAISSTNPDRLETFFRYKRSGVARIASTTAQAGFNFGT